MEPRLIVGISGASGAPLALAFLRGLRAAGVGAELIVSRGGELTLRQECGLEPQDLAVYADAVYDNDDLAAPPASGSHPSLGMAVVPCSMKTAAGICTGYSDNLLLRAADVALKERRRLVLAAREAPLSTLHLRNLYELSRLGAVIVPPVPAWYAKPETMAQAEAQIAARLLAQFGISSPEAPLWTGMEQT